jgi:choline dehydrogenase/5-(hydroxymethyl)furfural/furfural oxidase
MDHGLRDSALSLGYPWVPDHNAPHAFGVSTTASNIRDGARVSTNDAYLETARELPNADVKADVYVARVILDGDRAVGVRAVVGQTWEEYRAAEVILCAGALMTPAILQRSGIGPEPVLRRAGIIAKHVLPVGESLQDHAGFLLSINLRSAGPAANGLRGNCTFRYSSGLSDSGAGDSILTVINAAGQSATQWGLPGSQRSSTQQDGATGALLGKAFRCFSRGTVHVPSVDPVAMPVVRLNLLHDQRDRALMRHLLRRAIEVLSGPGFEGNIDAITDELGEAVNMTMTDAELDSWAKRVVRDTVHPSSSCRMAAPEDASGVVNLDLTVRGVQNLRVADLSVTPWAPRANTHLVAVMIGERAADLVTGMKTKPFVEHGVPDAMPNV